MADKEMTQEIDRLKKDIARLTRLTQRRVSDRWNDMEVDEVADKAKAYWAEASDKMKEQFEDARAKAKQTTKQADEYAHDNPWQVAGVAAAIGFVAALLLTAGKRDR